MESDPRLGIEREIDVVWHVIHQLREDIARLENHERNGTAEMSEVTQRLTRVEENGKTQGRLIWAAVTMLIFNSLLNGYAVYVAIGR